MMRYLIPFHWSPFPEWQ